MNDDMIKLQIFRLLKKIAPDTDPEKLQLDEDIRKTLDIDSFDYLVLMMDIDETFGIETPEQDYSKMVTLRQFIEYITFRSPYIESKQVG